MGTLYLIATPIGNLEDVTVRALAVLRQIDLLLCEDTRVTMRLLDRYGIKVPLESYREEVHRQRVGAIIARLREGRNIGLVSDAGTPGVSDPGSWLVREIMSAAPETQVIPIPGPSAVTAALSASGFPADEFVFPGFPPHKKGRATFIKKALEYEMTAVLYESTHRIHKLLEAIAAADPERQLCVARELTKMHETFYRGTASDIIKALGETSSKGEFVVMIAKKK
jgi:16S rRNA (cytidine1402-2'-O)-methyltransferase